MDPVEFRETLALGEPLREAHVDGDVIQNVALLGAVSLNNRIYTEQSLKDAARLYNRRRRSSSPSPNSCLELRA